MEARFAFGKLNAMPVLAFVFLLLISEVRAPRLAAYDPFAPSRPFIPIDRINIAYRY